MATEERILMMATARTCSVMVNASRIIFLSLDCLLLIVLPVRKVGSMVLILMRFSTVLP